MSLPSSVYHVTFSAAFSYSENNILHVFGALLYVLHNIDHEIDLFPNSSGCVMYGFKQGRRRSGAPVKCGKLTDTDIEPKRHSMNTQARGSLAHTKVSLILARPATEPNTHHTHTQVE